MVYKAVPPLYSIKEGKKNRYFTEQVDITRYIQRMFLQNNKFDDIKKNPISTKDTTIFFMRNMDYVYYLEDAASNYNVDPYLLEMVLNHYLLNGNSFKIDKLRKEIKSVYRFMDLIDINIDGKKFNVVQGTIDASNFIPLDIRFIADCENILRIIRENDSLYYNLNGKKSTIYTIMKVYNSIIGKVQRYKGLGEMPADDLAESTLYPGSDRTLIRYTMDDAKETINLIREYESNTKKILGEVGVVTREDLLD